MRWFCLPVNVHKHVNVCCKSLMYPFTTVLGGCNLKLSRNVPISTYTEMPLYLLKQISIYHLNIIFFFLNHRYFSIPVNPKLPSCGLRTRLSEGYFQSRGFLHKIRRSLSYLSYFVICLETWVASLLCLRGNIKSQKCWRKRGTQIK